MDKSTKCVQDAEKNADAPRLPNVTLLLRILPWRPLPTLPHPRVSVSHLPRPEGKAESLDVKRSISSRPFRFLRLVSPSLSKVVPKFSLHQLPIQYIMNHIL